MDDTDTPPAPPANAPAAPAAQPVRGHGCDVLIADDAGASRELLASILRNFAGRLEVRHARNGPEALQLWIELRPRITMLDIDMPGLDGLSVLQKIREAQPAAFVVIVSGTGSIEHVRQAMGFGAGGFVIKPYKPQRILDLLMKYGKQAGVDLLAGG